MHGTFFQDLVVCHCPLLSWPQLWLFCAAEPSDFLGSHKGSSGIRTGSYADPQKSGLKLINWLMKGLFTVMLGEEMSIWHLKFLWGPSPELLDLVCVRVARRMWWEGSDHPCPPASLWTVSTLGSRRSRSVLLHSSLSACSGVALGWCCLFAAAAQFPTICPHSRHHLEPCVNSRSHPPIFIHLNVQFDILDNI